MSKSKSLDMRSGKWGLPWHAWEDLPTLIQASLFWAFTQRGPSSPQDYARLHGAKYAPGFPDISWPAVFFREEPRWMDKALGQLWNLGASKLTAGRRRIAISLFLGYAEPSQVIAICDGTRDVKGDRWSYANSYAEGLLPHDEIAFRTLLTQDAPQDSDASAFVSWLLACDEDEAEPEDFGGDVLDTVAPILFEARVERDSQMVDPMGPLICAGRAISIQKESWDIVKEIRRIGSTLSYGYIPYQRPIQGDWEHKLRTGSMPPWAGPMDFIGDWRSGQKVGGGLNIDLSGLAQGAIRELANAKDGTPEHRMADMGRF